MLPHSFFKGGLKIGVLDLVEGWGLKGQGTRREQGIALRRTLRGRGGLVVGSLNGRHEHSPGGSPANHDKQAERETSNHVKTSDPLHRNAVDPP
jgi:hypothetical protein